MEDRMKTRRTLLAAVATSVIIVTGCNSAATASPPAAGSPAPSAAESAGASAAGSPASSGLSVTSFDSSFSAMSQLQSAFAAGKGLVGVILPDTTTSARYVSYDLPYLKQAFTAAGYAATDFKIDNAQGTTTTQLAIA